MTNEIFQNNFRSADYYRWPIILAVSLHLVIFVLLISRLFSPHPASYVAQKAIQANLISSAQLSQMMPQKKQAMPSAPKPVLQLAQPPKKVVPVTKSQQMPKSTAIEPPATRPILKKTSPIKSVPMVTKPLVKPISKKEQEKLIEKLVLQEESNQTLVKKKQVKLDKTQQEDLMANQLATEEAQQQTQQRSQATSAEIDQYKAKILQQIQQNWIMPENVENLSCLLEVQLAPGGVVLDVKVLKSSGNPALDRSAIAAVNKSSPLPAPKDSAAFAAFRSFTLTVKPNGSQITEG
jgi:colicin import membrane protein